MLKLREGNSEFGELSDVVNLCCNLKQNKQQRPE
jgi:hypothetical protein